MKGKEYKISTRKCYGQRDNIREIMQAKQSKMKPEEHAPKIQDKHHGAAKVLKAPP